jgi:hypothetical protein
MNTTMTQDYSYMRPQTSQQSRTSMMGNFTQIFDTPKMKQQQDTSQLINTDKNVMSDLTVGTD